MKEGNKMYDAVILRYEGSYTVDGNEVIITLIQLWVNKEFVLL